MTADLSQLPKVATCLSTTVAEADLIEFIDDTISYLKGQKVPFLSRYN